MSDFEKACFIFWITIIVLLTLGLIFVFIAELIQVVFF